MSLLIKEIFYIIYLIIASSGVFFIAYKYVSNIRKQYMIKNFSDYIVALEYHQEKAYDMIHKDRILIYSAEGVKLNDDEFNVISKDYAKLVFQFMGETISDELISLYGVDALTMNMLEYFNTRYEEDEIRKNSVENLLNKDSIIEEEQQWQTPTA